MFPSSLSELKSPFVLKDKNSQGYVNGLEQINDNGAGQAMVVANPPRPQPTPQYPLRYGNRVVRRRGGEGSPEIL
jgi:hypothetical protein